MANQTVKLMTETSSTLTSRCRNTRWAGLLRSTARCRVLVVMVGTPVPLMPILTPTTDRSHRLWRGSRRLSNRSLAWRYLTQLPQGLTAARVSELFRVRGGLFTSRLGQDVRPQDAVQLGPSAVGGEQLGDQAG